MRIPKTFLMTGLLLALGCGAGGQDAPNILPTVVQHSDPVYPPLARQTRIQGEVRVKVTTDGESIRDAEAESGNPLLRKAAEDNARTWKFAPHTPGVFHVSYRYKLLGGDTDVEFLLSPGVIKIEVSPPVMNIYYADIGLGTWKAQLKSAHGKSSQIFSLFYTGAEGDWLGGRIVSRTGEGEEIDFGHMEGDFVAFTIKLTQPDGKRLKTFLVGKINGNKIVGTFVDDAGIKGEWSAIRTGDKS